MLLNDSRDRFGTGEKELAIDEAPGSLRSLSFRDRLAFEGLGLYRSAPAVLQLNLGRLCNLTCSHCHVNAGPRRKEIMGRETMDRILDWLRRSPTIQAVDLTGGAPEMNPDFQYLISKIRSENEGVALIDRCNLTILLEPGFESLPQFLAAHRVEIVASMPCYQAENVNRQRGEGVFDASIEGLRRLNAAGFGVPGGLALNLVYNPSGLALPPDQLELERDFKEALRENFQIEFNRLYTLTNMPIARFLSQLKREGRSEEYHHLLVDHFNPSAVAGLMCRDTISVDWVGKVYDCDFNQMLGMPLGGRRRGDFLWDLDSHSLSGETISVGDHCYGCAAGAGSSCGGALSV